MKDRLTTSSYCFILAANFLLYFGFWLLIPVLPFYLSEFFQAGNSTIGIVLSCYTVAALCIRPFSGYLLDTFVGMLRVTSPIRPYQALPDGVRRKNPGTRRREYVRLLEGQANKYINP